MNRKRGILFISIWAFVISSVYAAQEPQMPGNFKNPDAVKEVLSKKRSVANAAWWGFDPVDSTQAIQEAVNSGAEKVIIPYMGGDWIVRPVKLNSNQEINFDPGVVVLAKKGEFRGKDDCLFSAAGKNNITLRGYGAVLKMRKGDYLPIVYSVSEFRHVLSFRGCGDIKVLGLEMKDSGGDGIFLGTEGQNRVPCTNVLIQDCICDNNYRQGLSVISIENLRVENCVFKNTDGTRPKAGVDIEPSNARDKLVNVVISNCTSDNNKGAGFEANISRLSTESPVVSVLFVNCYVRSGYGPGLLVLAEHENNHAKGLIEFRNCVCENTTYEGVCVLLRPDPTVQVRFSDCKWRNVATRRTKIPVNMILKKSQTAERTGGVEFLNSTVYDEKKRPFLNISEAVPGKGVYNIKGSINVCNPYGAKTDPDLTSSGIPFKVVAFPRDSK